MKNILLSLILFLLFASNCCSQSWVWEKTAGTGGGYGRSVTVDATGNAFVTGALYNPSITFGNTTLTNAGSSIVFVAKYDGTGHALWAKSAGGTDNNGGNSISADPNGNVYATGYYINTSITFDAVTLSNSGNADAFIVKYDGDGNVQWARSIGGSGVETGYCASVDAGGNIFIIGSFSSAVISIGSFTLNNSDPSGTTSDAFIAKYNSSGTLMWAQSVGGVNDDYGRGVSADAHGNVFITGYFNSPTVTISSTTIANDSVGTNDAFIIKCASNGNVLWAKTIVGGGNDAGASVSVDAGGNAFVTGGFSSSSITLGTNTLVNASAGTDDIFVAKYGVNGNVLWAKRAGDIGDDYGISLSSDLNGSVFVTGGFSIYTPSITFDATTLTPANYSGCVAGPCDPMFIVQYDANGNVLCGSALQSGSDDRNAVCAGASGNAYLTGDFDANYFILGADTFHTTIGDEFFIAKYSGAGGLGVNEVHAANFVTIYPNPSTGIFGITIRNVRAETKICVRDVLGNCVLDKGSVKNENQEIDLSKEAPGIYFVEVIAGNTRNVKKILVK